jgi:hypothetical protein
MVRLPAIFRQTINNSLHPGREVTIGRDSLKIAADIRTISGELLPLDNSFIPFDLLLKIGLAHLNNDDLTLKSLFASLPHSEMGIRYHFRRLLANGWIEVHTAPSDRRFKLVVPTSKLLDQLTLLDQEFTKLMKQHLPRIDE